LAVHSNLDGDGVLACELRRRGGATPAS
jgi:hypothetical protein